MAHFDRRQLAAGLAAAWLAPTPGFAQTGSLPARGPARLILPSPIFPLPDRVPITVRSGERPHRRGSYRLEPEVIGTKFVVHNYGHGGGGITMSQGCAAEVLSIVTANRAALPDRRVAILGAGVMGMAVATALKKASMDVTLYSRAISPNTTSDVAGGQWAPSVVDHDDRAKYLRILRNSYQAFVAASDRYGVTPRDNYTFESSDELEYAELSGAAPAERMLRLPFERVTRGGWRYPTLLVEPPVYLGRMHRDLRSAGVAFQTRSFNSPEQVLALPEPTIINCLGLGSRNVWADPALTGQKGVLAMLPPQRNLPYLYSGIGYLFPRRDHLVVGGSWEPEGAVDTHLTDTEKGQLIVKIVRAVFQGALPAPTWLSGTRRITARDML
ncbi:D-amino-acid oxidase [Brevundimonas intermedia]|uniref:D-amino-acid oxidase n=1 Tax=Brevundimonas intermedia TaxID=74315 RepID=A0ABQ5TBE5_9CAUL|nr:FAD-dependent oxidoreductase [Brevundimonas intermedia]GLK50139.1 D-amino-acid oxidase [Brevundimonas intermedia]